MEKGTTLEEFTPALSACSMIVGNSWNNSACGFFSIEKSQRSELIKLRFNPLSDRKGAACGRKICHGKTEGF